MRKNFAKGNLARILKAAALSFAALALAACASSRTDSARTADAESSDYGELPFGLPQKKYVRILKDAQLSPGNNFRLKAALEKLRSGGDFYAACIGGSVTEGAGPKDYRDGYAYRFAEELKKRFASGGTEVRFAAAGLSGTPSTLGLLRYDDDVTGALGRAPDLLVVEFAVNDGGDIFYKKSFEAILRRALLANRDCAVISLFSAATYPNQQANMRTISEHYRVPCVSISDSYASCAGFYFTERQFFADSVHPTREGHKIMADSLVYLLEEADGAETDAAFAVPARPLYAPSLENMRTVKNDAELLAGTADLKFDAGCFSERDSTVQFSKGKGAVNFPCSFYKPAGVSGSPMTAEGEMRALFIAYKENGAWNGLDFGAAEVLLDGECVMRLDGAREGGWNNVVTVPVFGHTSGRRHRVEIRMAAGSEKKAFTVVALGIDTGAD